MSSFGRATLLISPSVLNCGRMQVARRRSIPERRRLDGPHRKHLMGSPHLRNFVEKMNREVACASATDANADDEQALTSVWESLVEHLALGPAPRRATVRAPVNT